MSIHANTTNVIVFKTLVICLIATAILQPLLLWIEPTNIAMLFMLVVLACSWAWGKMAGILSACISIAAFDFFFVAPRFSFTVADVQYVITFVVMLVVAISISYLLSTVRYKQAQAEQQTQQISALYVLATDLMKTLQINNITEVSTQFIRHHLGLDAFLLLPSFLETAQPQTLEEASSVAAISIVERLTAQSLFNNDQRQSLSIINNDGDTYSLHVPLQGATRTRGVLLVRSVTSSEILYEKSSFLEAIGSIVAIAIERLHYIEVAHKTEQQMENERLRSSILSALSHDIRTPLTAMYGLADSLTWLDPKPSVTVLETSQRLCEQALQLNQMVSNLLELSKLQSGKIVLIREWIPLEEIIGSSLRLLSTALIDIQVHIDIPPDMALYIDAVLFERVIANLLDNAIKYNEPKQRTKYIHITAYITEAYSRICIFNPAQALSDIQLKNIFTKFERLFSESGQAGTGIGLSIAQTIVHAHGGKIYALMHKQNTHSISAGAALEPLEEGLTMYIDLPRITPPVLEAYDIEPVYKPTQR